MRSNLSVELAPIGRWALRQIATLQRRSSPRLTDRLDVRKLLSQPTPAGRRVQFGRVRPEPVVQIFTAGSM